jgi:hypothetical protein
VKRTSRLVLGITGMVILSFAFLVVFTTARGYTAWYIRISNATIAANGKTIPGQLYRNLTGRTFLFTSDVSATGKPRTYLLGFSVSTPFVKSCGDWIAERSSLIVNRTIPPPCSIPGGSANSPEITKNYIAFIDDFGEKLEASWQ